MMLFKKKTLIYQDNTGNKMFEDVDRRLILQNHLGKIVKPKEIKPFIKKPGVKQAISKFYNQEVKFKEIIKPKVKGGLYK